MQVRKTGLAIEWSASTLTPRIQTCKKTEIFRKCRMKKQELVIHIGCSAGGEAPMRRKNPARREFLKKAAIAGAGLAALPAILGSLPRVVADSEEDSPGYHFVVVSKTSTTPPDLVALEGNGHVTHSKATGGGVFTHFVPTGSPPFPIRGAGTWKPERVVNFGLIGSYG